MEGARGDEQDVVGLHRPVLRRHRRAFDQRQQIALHPLAARHPPRRATSRARRHLVDLVDETRCRLLHRLDRLAGDRLLVEQLVGFFVIRTSWLSATLMRRRLLRPEKALPNRSSRLPCRPSCRRVGRQVHHRHRETRRRCRRRRSRSRWSSSVAVAQLTGGKSRASRRTRAGPTSASSTRSSAAWCALGADLVPRALLAHHGRSRLPRDRG